jgi:hypothetical protein
MIIALVCVLTLIRDGCMSVHFGSPNWVSGAYRPERKKQPAGENDSSGSAARRV